MESRKDKFERWARQWDDKLPNLSKALRSKELQDQLAFIENFNPMNTPISPETAIQIDNDANRKPELRSKTYGFGFYDGYSKGATIYAAKWEQAKKALEEMVDVMQWMWDNCRLQEGKEYLQSDLFNRPANALEQANNLLATWKEEGKEGGV